MRGGGRFTLRVSVGEATKPSQRPRSSRPLRASVKVTAAFRINLDPPPYLGGYGSYEGEQGDTDKRQAGIWCLTGGQNAVDKLDQLLRCKWLGEGLAST